MEADRFDTLAKALATKLSRRSTMRRGGVGLAATMLAAAGLRSGTAAATTTTQQSSFTGYSVIRRYTLSGSTDTVQQVLATGFLPIVQQESGYIAYSVVVSPNNTITTITVFASQAQLETAAQSEANWVQQNLASLLPAPAEETKGNTSIFDVNANQICGPAPTPTATATVQPTNPATAAPCTGIGCACNGGVQNACDEGLVCCQSQMNGGPIPGGAGMCAAADACGDQGNATPVS